jgi:hypothetical protein
MGDFISCEMDARYEKKESLKKGVWMVENMSQIMGPT